MPAPQRRQTTGVIEQLLREPQQFGFFQAVRLLERWLATPEGLRKHLEAEVARWRTVIKAAGVSAE